MSLRIHNDAISNGASADVNRTGQTGPAGAGSGKGRIGSGSGTPDSVDISSAAESISAGVSAQNLQHAAKVTELSELYASGRYSVDSAKVSSALVDSSISGSTAGEA